MENKIIIYLIIGLVFMITPYTWMLSVIFFGIAVYYSDTLGINNQINLENDLYERNEGI